MIRFIIKPGKTLTFIANMNMIKALNKNCHIVLIFSVLLLTGCHNFMTDPKPFLLDTELDTGPPEYRAGYKDGCHSAMAAYGTSYMKSVYKINKEAQYATNRMYNQAWKDAWGFCYMFIFMQRTDDDSFL